MKVQSSPSPLICMCLSCSDETCCHRLDNNWMLNGNNYSNAEDRFAAPMKCRNPGAVDALSFQCQTAAIFQMIHMCNFMCLQIAPSNKNFSIVILPVDCIQSSWTICLTLKAIFQKQCSVGISKTLNGNTATKKKQLKIFWPIGSLEWVR